MCVSTCSEIEFSGVIYYLHNGDFEPRYIGQTIKKPLYRLSSHKHSARNGSTLPSHTWMRKHGVDNIQMCVLETFSEDTVHLIDEREVFLIAQAKSEGLRLTNLAEGGSVNRGFEVSEETRKKISLAGKGRKRGPLSEEHRAILSAVHKGKTISEEQRRNQSEMMKGNTIRRGTTMSAESRAKMSAARIGLQNNDPLKSNHVRWHTNRGIVKEGCHLCV